MLYPDLLQRFLPIPILPDRAQALESSWQTSWRSAMDKPRSAGLNMALSSVSPGKSDYWQPGVFLNSTHVETGKRVVASSVKLDPEQFLDAVDLLSILKQNVSLGTAAVNSARFTYVSPPGTLPCGFFCDNGHVVDGGYFENFGAVTALQLINSIPKSMENQYRLVVILISSDSALAKAGQTIEDNTPPATLESEAFANEILGPVRALLSTRNARGILAAKELRAAAIEKNGGFFHFRMDIKPGQVEPALGWVLSKQSEDLMRDLLQSADYNKQQFAYLLMALSGNAAVSQGSAK